MRSLLQAYHDALDVLDRDGILVSMRRGRGRIGRFRRLRGSRHLVRYFALNHVHRRLGELGRAYMARTALADDRDVHAPERERVERLQASLDAVPKRRIAAAAVAAVLLLTQALLPLVQVDFLRDEAEAAERGADLVDKLTNALLTLQPQQLSDSLQEIGRQDLTSIVVVVAVLLIAIRLTLHPGIKAFQVKRAVFNLRPREFAVVRRATASDHHRRTDGIYALEAETFRALGTRPRPEFPLDVALGASVLSIPFLLGFGFLSIALRGEREGDVPLGLFYAALFLIPSVLRSISLARTWKSRRRVGNHGHQQS